jgi:hypothetical protein
VSSIGTSKFSRAIARWSSTGTEADGDSSPLPAQLTAGRRESSVLRVQRARRAHGAD